jgi:glutathionylspermidine amidase/synthetase
MSAPAEAIPRAKFGTVLGIAPGGVRVYSCDYQSADDRALPNRHAYRSYLDGVYLGYKWQCVELARRFLYVNYGYIFDDVAMAYEIFRLRSVRVVKENRRLPLRSFKNGSRRHPEPGCLLIWTASGEFVRTGHVAVVTEVSPNSVRFVEQNVTDQVWPEGQAFSREIHAKVTPEGEYWLECSFGDATILGWVSQTDDDTDAEVFEKPDLRLFKIAARTVQDVGQSRRSWLNVANPDEAAYVDMMRGHRLAGRDEDQHRYYAISESVHAELVRATNELHALFMHATDYTLQDDALLARFNLPRAVWPKIHQSWDNRRNQMITGRFDFSVSERGLRIYEYNSDSAACHMECGKVQGKWAQHFGCDEGDDPGERLHAALVEAWRNSDVDDTLHILHDHDKEESYHALFMKEALEAAGIECKVMEGFAGLRFDDDGNVRDADGALVKWVWKTWAWETALDQIRAECEDDEERLARYEPGLARQGVPRLVDVLLRKSVMVYEPLWTLVPSNKAILPILWKLFPNHPYLLRSAYTLTDELRATGYVAKPIAGRGGANIQIFAPDSARIEQTAGRFGAQDHVYQERFPLPVLDGYHVQISTFTAAGTYAGSCVRFDRSPIIHVESDNLALRVVDDDDILEEP